MSTKEPPGGGGGGKRMTFDLVLHSTKLQTTEHRQLKIKELPPNACIFNLKQEIEEQFNIPVCVQNLIYESQSHGDTARLDALRIRSGDGLLVEYYSEGNCQEILQVIKWMSLLLAMLKTENPSVATGISQELEDLVMMGIEAEFIEDLAFEYFFPWLSPKKYANKLHFVYNGGVDIILELYGLLLRNPWPQCLLKLKYIEYGILRILWNLSETFALRRLIVMHGGLQMCMKSLQRKVLEKGKQITDEESPGDRNHDWILVETIGAALGTLCNLSELPECHKEIAVNPAVLLQLTCISHTPSVRVMSPQLVATCFLCVAYTPETHPHLANPQIVGGLLEACTINRTFGREEDQELDSLMLQYFTQVYLAQLIMVSPQHVPVEYYPQIHNHMSKFLKATNHDVIMKGEVKHWYVWSTFIPYVKLLYLPEMSTAQPEPLHRLTLLSLETVLFGLLNMLGRENHREVLAHEGLVDFVILSPSYVPHSLRPLARDLVQLLASSGDLRVQPPALVSLVKARLAKIHFGLERVLKMSVGEIISEILPS